MMVELSHGPVEVQPVPPFLYANIEAAHPIPAQLDPEAAAQALAARERLQRETAWLVALAAVTPPAGWRFPAALAYAGLQPREGEAGRKLDYIEYALLATAEDVQRVQAVMYGGALTEAEIGAAEAAFPGDGRRAAAAEYPTRAE